MVIVVMVVVLARRKLRVLSRSMRRGRRVRDRTLQLRQWSV
jgi:Sec-independent protein translocase protein TatA